MKSLKRLIPLLAIMIFLAVSLPVSAIGFVAEDVYESVFVIYSGNSLGSGFAIGKDCIVTNAHVISDVNNVVVKSFSGEEHEAFVIGLNVEQDIAVLGVEDVEFKYLSIVELSSVNVGDDIYAIGAPKSMEYTLTKGIISAKNREVGKYKYIQIDAAINEGNSGGPLLNEAGEVLGINTLKMSDAEGIGLAIPIETVMGYMSDIGLEVDYEGNVTGDVKEDAAKKDKAVVKNKTTKKEQEDSKGESVITIIAVVSIVINIILTVLLLGNRKKKDTVPYDPSERTDFEIDILE